MKRISISYFLSFSLLFFLSHFQSLSQVDNSGCVIGNFGIDADLYSGALPYGDHTPATPGGTDDWFFGPTGKGVIDTSNSAAIRAGLQGPGDYTFEARMNGNLGAIVDGRTWFDAVYARDNFGGTGFVDPTAFPVSSKNTQPPTSWSAGPANVLGKNDLLDVGAHLRRIGTAINSPLILTGLISRAEPGGAAYMDMEFFIENVTYTNGVGFSSAGPDLGHKGFRFNANGTLAQMGDMLVNISLNSGGTQADLEIRIWVKRADRLNPALIPANFNWGVEYDGPTTSSEYVYAAILPKTAGNACGYVNVATQLPFAPRWGHKGTKTNTYGNSFSEFSLAEIGINLTNFGLDPAFIPGYDPCRYPHKSFCVKTRSSAAFTAALKDFCGPFSWCGTKPIVSSGGMLSCLNQSTTLTPVPQRNDATFQWSTTNGNITSATNIQTITVNQIGDYTLNVVLPNGCNLDPSTYTVDYDPTKPFFGTTATSSTIACSGNTGSVNITPSGATTPYTYTWTGPSSFTSTNEDLTNVAAGNYSVTIKDIWNCTTTATVNVAAGTPVNFGQSITNVTCNNLTNGSITLNPVGTSPFTYSWSNGQTVKNLLNVGAGTYTINVTDANNCVWTNNFTITQPTTLSSSLVKTNDSNSDPAVGNGSIDLTVTGGTAAYTYSWTGPSTYTANTQDISSLKYGQYSVTITDSKNCTTTNSAFIYEPEICNDGIDNDGNGLTDCDDPVCKPASPGTITPSVNPPCINTNVTYTVVDNPLVDYVWTVPAGSTIVSGQGTNSITVQWQTTQGGNVCVKADNVGCLSTPSCILISPVAVPSTPGPVNFSNN